MLFRTMHIAVYCLLVLLCCPILAAAQDTAGEFPHQLVHPSKLWNEAVNGTPWGVHVLDGTEPSQALEDWEALQAKYPAHLKRLSVNFLPDETAEKGHYRFKLVAGPMTKSQAKALARTIRNKGHHCQPSPFPLNNLYSLLWERPEITFSEPESVPQVRTRRVEVPWPMGEHNQHATELIKQGEYSDAYDYLYELLLEGKYDNQSLFLLGVASNKLEDYDNSIFYFQQVLERDPNAQRVRLELANSLYMDGRYEQAETVLTEVKMASPPPQVMQNIDQFMAFIHAAVPEAWQGYISLGYLYDTNVNQGPSSDTVEMWGLPFTLNQDARDNSDHAVTMDAALNRFDRLNHRFTWLSSLKVRRVDYSDVNTYDVLDANLSTGPIYRKNRFTLSTPIGVNWLSFGEDAFDTYSHSFKFSPQAGYTFSPIIAAFLASEISYTSYADDTDRDTFSWHTKPSVRFNITPNAYIEPGFEYGQNNDHYAYYDNDYYGASATLYIRFAEQWGLLVQPSLRDTEYGAAEAAFSEEREDERTMVVTSLSYDIPDTGFTISASYMYLDNQSNIGLYDYNRQQVTTSIMWKF